MSVAILVIFYFIKSRFTFKTVCVHHFRYATHTRQRRSLGSNLKPPLNVFFFKTKILARWHVSVYLSFCFYRSIRSLSVFYAVKCAYFAP